MPSIIAGVSSPRQVKANAKAAAWQSSAREKGEVDAILDREAALSPA